MMSPVGGLWGRGDICKDGWMDEGERGKEGREPAYNEGCNGWMK